MPAGSPPEAAGPVDVAATTAIPAPEVDVGREPEPPTGEPAVTTIPGARDRRGLSRRLLIGAIATISVVALVGVLLPRGNGSPTAGSAGGSAPGAATSSPAGSAAGSAASTTAVVPIIAGLPDPRSILFDSTYNDDVKRIADLEMMALEPTSLALTQLTSNDVDDTMPTWSRDHSRIVFVRRDNAPRHHLYVRDSSGHEQRLTTDGSNCSDDPATIDEYNPAWSSTDWIAYVCQTATAVSSIRIVKADGSEDHEVATGEYVRAPAWSPDGTTLLYMSASSDPQVTKTTNTYDLFRLILGGRGPQNLTNTRDITERRPSWSTDGRTIAFVMDHGADGDADNDIFKRVITNSTPAIQLTDTPGQFAVPLQDGGPVWSPDGSQIAFIRATDEQATGFHIWRMAADGTAPEDLTKDRPGLNTDPSWR
jgi:Tol biopolymer transport system component